MWLRLDDGFATHPKILTAGPYALVIQVRAICYASKNKTDGFLPFSVVPYLLIDIPGEDWPATMLTQRLWEPHAQGYMVHDYLQWNVSKQQQDEWKNSLSEAGKKGMKARWGKGKRMITKVITKDITGVNNQPITSLSTSTASLNALNSPNPEWFESLKSNPLYQHVDFGRERAKMDLWKSQPVNRNRKLTQRFVIGWLNKIEPPLGASNGSTNRPPPPPPKNDPIGRGQWGKTYGDPKEYGYD